MRLTAVLLAALLPACGPEVPDGDDPIDEVKPLPECDDGVRLSGTLAVPEGVTVAADATLGLVAMDFEEAPALDVAAQVTLVEGLAEGEVATWSLCLDVPADAWFQAVEDGAEMEIAAFVVGVWDDADGDANPTAGEALVGTDPRLVVYARGEAVPELTDAGGDLGWNVLVVGDEGIESGEHLADAKDDFALASNLAPHTPGELNGVLVPDLDGDEVNIGLYNMWEMFDADQPAETTLHGLVDIAATGDVEWTLKGLTGAPPADHLQPMNPDIPIGDWSLYVAGAWVDHDGDNQMDFEDGEPVVAASVVDEQGEAFVMAGYVRPTSFLMGQFTAQLGLRPGWGLYVMDDVGDRGLFPVDWDEGMELVRFSPN